MLSRRQALPFSRPPISFAGHQTGEVEGSHCFKTSGEPENPPDVTVRDSVWGEEPGAAGTPRGLSRPPSATHRSLRKSLPWQMEEKKTRRGQGKNPALERRSVALPTFFSRLKGAKL